MLLRLGLGSCGVVTLWPSFVNASILHLGVNTFATFVTPAFEVLYSRNGEWRRQRRKHLLMCSFFAKMLKTASTV